MLTIVVSTVEVIFRSGPSVIDTARVIDAAFFIISGFFWHKLRLRHDLLLL